MAFQKTKHPAKPVTTDEALAKLEYFCAYRERCPKEVRSKLSELGISRSDAEQIFEVLQSDGFFDEARFAVAYAGGKFRINHWGRVRIRQELRMRDIAPAIVQRALDSIDDAEYRTCLKQLLDKKRRQYAGDAREREKTAASLIRAGFEPELVFQYL
ncbi:MAG: RecX family transcriptional regulator [Lewinellaceae bacterium]|jgi:regulatory protein|nr:RecX family transcriptional regulator [Lewinellaceae bacterium]